jgi:Double zinc ribbon
MGNESSSRLVPPLTSRLICPICGHVNPADSRFCNACGAPLYLAPCSRCGAMNDRAAAQCHECGTPLTNRWADGAPLPSSSGDSAEVGASVASRGNDVADLRPAGHATDQPLGGTTASPQEALRELRRLMAAPLSGKDGGKPQTSREPRKPAAPHRASGPPTDAVPPGPHAGANATQTLPAGAEASPRLRRSAWIVGTMAVVAAVLAGYYAYGPRPADDTVPPFPSAAGEQKDGSGPAQNVPTVTVEGEPGRTAPTALPSGPIGASAGAADNVQPVSPATGRAVAPPDSTGAAAADERPTGGDVKEAPRDAATQPAPPPAAAPRKADTQRAAARAVPRPVEANPAEAVLIPRPQAPGAGARTEPPPPRLGPCTEALAALGLCNQEPAQRRE